jgi:hypothetical protein
MKALPLYLLLVLPIISSGEEIPRGAFKSSQFEAAREAAKAQGKALIYIETDSKSSCPKTQWGTAEAYSELKRDYVLVVEDDADPEKVDVSALNSAITKTSKIGNFTPRVTVVEPDKLEFITGTDYSNMYGDKRWAKKLDEAVTVALAAKKESAMPATPAEPAAEKPEFTDWSNTDGKVIRAALVEKKANLVVLKLENGKTIEYPIEKLSQASKWALDGK